MAPLSCPLRQLSLSACYLSLPSVMPASQVCLPRHTQRPGPALCAARVVCAGWMCMPHHSRLPELLSVSCERAEKYSFLCLLPSKSLLCLVFQDSPLGPPVREFPCAPELLFQGFLPTLWGTRSCPILHHFLFVSPNSLLPHFRELSLSL